VSDRSGRFVFSFKTFAALAAIDLAT
jgi:hypothetical protein